MWDRLSTHINDYLDHNSIEDLFWDTWRYLLAFAVLAYAARYWLQRRKRKNNQ